jgi:Fe2+ or Zn2+ uptake regulation protein
MISAKDARLAQLLAQLYAKGRCITPQREVICEALLAHGGHPTPVEIYALVRETNPTISQATVYNTILVLEELELVRKLDLIGDKHAHYDLQVEPHVNLVCTYCRRIADIYTDTLEALLALVTMRSGYKVDPSRGAIIYGCCAECQRAMISELPPDPSPTARG